ncbi:peroxisome assembly protein 26-like [Littorina saxatilis]|uniref:Uncharacterized protein n=1 Tax=Littorina saxatilis TaxID=31220 RepID=A0AAN9GD32_9CAEN
MECEVKKGENSNPPSLIVALEEQVKTATDKLLLTNFSACLEICHNVVAAARNCEDADPDIVERLDKVREAATVIGIQALAEQGAWRDVIPFVEQVYTHAAACPATIMQMCLLLHAQVREYMVCHTLFNTWLEWDDHVNHPDCGAIVKIYVTTVLAPLGAFNLIPQVVERCSTLTSEERQALLSPKIAASSVQKIPGLVKSVPDHGDQVKDHSLLASDETRSTDEVKSDRPPSGYRIITLYLNLARQLYRRLAKKGWCQQIRRASKLFFLISFIILALIHVQTDVTANFSRAMEVWRTAIRSLSSMWTRPAIKQL